jgi:hypothetical protein
MLTYDSVKDFLDYLNDDESSLEKDWVDQGLKPGAPDKAVKAYKKYIEEEKAAKKAGIIR